MTNNHPMDTSKLVLVAVVILFLFTSIFAQTRQMGQEREVQKGNEDDEILRIGVHVVSIPVAVTDRQGRFIADLKGSDFRIIENTREQRITYFASTEQPFSVLLLIDTSGSTNLNIHDMQEAAIAFVNQLRPQDQMLPVAFDNQTVALLPEWTSDRERLSKAIRSIHTGMVVLPQDTRTIQSAAGKTGTIVQVSTRLYDAIHDSAMELRRLKGRKALIVFTDGLDTGSLSTTYKSTLRELEEFDALTYTVQYGERTHPIARALYPGSWQIQLGRDRAEDYLKAIAEKTGGRYYRAGSLAKIAQSFSSVAKELRVMYSIGYEPDPLPKPGERPNVEVKVRRGHVIVRARPSYVFQPLK